MTAISTTMPLSFMASDISRQQKVSVRDVPRDTTVRELVQGLLARMGLVRADVRGKPLQYRALLESEGRHLHDSELVGDAISPDSEIVLQPRINAG